MHAHDTIIHPYIIPFPLTGKYRMWEKLVNMKSFANKPANYFLLYSVVATRSSFTNIFILQLVQISPFANILPQQNFPT